MSISGIQEFTARLKELRDTGGIVQVTGLTEGAAALACARLMEEAGGQILIIVSTRERAKQMEEYLSFFLKGKRIFLLPDEERSMFAYEAKSRLFSYERIRGLSAALSGEECVFVAPVMAAARGMIGAAEFLAQCINIRKDDTINYEEIREKLTDSGYERTDVTEVRGQFSVRGEIIDIFPPDSEYPCRIDLFDDRVDDLKLYDPITQRSVRAVDYVRIIPAVVRDPKQPADAEFIWDYMTGAKTIFADDWDRICGQHELADRDWTDGLAEERKIRRESAAAAREEETVRAGKALKDAETAESGPGRAAVQAENTAQTGASLEPVETAENVKIGQNAADVRAEAAAKTVEAGKMDEAPTPEENENSAFSSGTKRHTLKNFFSEYFADMYEIVAALRKYGGAVSLPFQKKAKLIDDVEHANISVLTVPEFEGRMDYYAKELRRLLEEKYIVRIACGSEERIKNLQEFARRMEIDAQPESLIYEEGVLPHGFFLPQTKEAWISDNDIFKNSKRRKKKKESPKKNMSLFADLREGDYVVHENHGIGRFIGIEPLCVEGNRKDYLKIKYADDGLLYVPVEQMDLVQKYIGSGGTAPKLNKMDNGDWKKTKARAKAAIEHMAEDLVKMAAERTIHQGHAFSADTVWQHEFEEQFPYVETDNQLRCIEEIKRDMEMPWPMDRLLCGDVGFGKTEIAARAIFKCVMDGKQAALLAPTTILAHQHYRTFLERFEHFPFNIEVMSRFRSDAQQREIMKRVADGRIDILIGTHRILSKDVKFKDLGLLVIDEEQRFGVKHKEAMKQIKKNIDVLTLSATPIPRTLHMSLSGIRSMSTLDEPIDDRYPVQTYVLEQDDDLIREIIRREMGRDGQTFVVFNRVNGIQEVADGLRNLVPEARIAVGHGQMPENKLDDIMMAFMEHEYDVLVATTIIESGIDIPNANTLIILDADHFGLSQLYQLRGRVGRSNRVAYAYLMYRKDKILSEPAEQRLKAIKEFTEFGSSFKIAMKDLEIRGAGNLLGTEQSGHMMMIGYELYCKLIDNAVRKLRGESVQDEELEVSLDIKVNAFISSDYIEDEKLKLDMYKRIADIRSESDVSDVRDELIDRFGDVPAETETLMQVALIKAKCQTAGIRRVSLEDRKVVFEFAPDNNRLDTRALLALSEKYGMKLIINMSRKPFIKMPVEKNRKMLSEIIEFLSVFR